MAGRRCLQPLPSIVAGKFNLWLGREKNAGRDYSPEQVTWLTTIRDHLAQNGGLKRKELQDVPTFFDKGGLLKAQALFGPRLDEVLGDLSDALVA